MSLPSRRSGDDPRVQREHAEADAAARRRSVDPSYRRERRYEEITAWPMFVLSLVFFAASVVLFDIQRPTRQWDLLLSVTVVVLWIVFIVDYLVRLALAMDRLQFLRRRWFELLAIAIPYLRPFVILSYLWRLPVFSRSEQAVRARFVVGIVVFALVFVYTGSSVVYLAERADRTANITTFGDAIWWGFATITTVGYGDYTPVTLVGRIVAVLMMIGGIVVVGVTSAVVVSVLLDQMERFGYRMTAQVAADRRHAAATASPDAAGRPASSAGDAAPSPGPAP